MKSLLTLVTLFILPVILPVMVLAEQSADQVTRQYTFAWNFAEQDKMKPRGGTTTGAPLTLVKEASPEWLALQEPGLSRKEKDRRAILAMAGPYRASFDFLETVGFTPGYEPPAPYQSWGTEYVYVVSDEPDFISLQHVLVMFMVMPDGTTTDAIVVKHWRQDWSYQDRDLYEYVGHNKWQHRRLPRRDVTGTWSQAVYQVDDSPRYHSYGKWEHKPGYSSWISAETWRPLPRREFSVRGDYHALVGFNRHTITPTGWVHEEDNKKTVLADDGSLAEDTPFIAIEAGFNRYERITDHDWSAGDAYWQKTGPFWAEVRSVWQTVLNEYKGVSLADEVDGQSLFMTMFSLASEHPKETFEPASARAAIESSLRPFIK